MSLAADDGEGEQNELRNLQQQLESTNKLVQTLSSQLSELKEQVRQTMTQTREKSLEVLSYFWHFLFHDSSFATSYLNFLFYFDRWQNKGSRNRELDS